MFIDRITYGLSADKAFFTPITIIDENPLTGNKKLRIITPQSYTMRVIQDGLKEVLRRQRWIVCKSATGAVKKLSRFKSIARHRRLNKSGRYYFPRHFFLTDIQNAYGSVSIEKLANILTIIEAEAKPNKEELILAFLKKYCEAKEGGIATGATASPDLFNIYCEVLIDRTLRDYCTKHNITYTRYLDDLVFSANEKIGAQKRRFIRKLLESVGLKLSSKKTHVYDLQKRPIFVNGVGINIDGDMFTPRKFTSELKGLLHGVVYGKIRVSKNVVLGKIGIFTECMQASGRGPNTTERKVLKLIGQFKAIHC